MVLTLMMMIATASSKAMATGRSEGCRAVSLPGHENSAASVEI